MPLIPNEGTLALETSQAQFALVYQELRRIARSQRRTTGAALTLDTTALVHEVYLKLHAAPAMGELGRAHFLSLAARAMRQILVDSLRRRGRLKRSGRMTLSGWCDEIDSGAADLVDVLALDQALAQLSELDARAGQLVEWHIFGGVSIEDIAALQGLTVRTVFRDWRKARAFLIQRLGLAKPD